MLRPVGLCAAFIFAAAGAAVAADALPTVLSVACDKESGRYSVEANGSMLSELLRQTEKRCGVKFKLEPEGDKPVTLHFKGLTVENGLRLLGEEASLNYLLFVTPESASAPPGMRKVTEFRVISSGKGTAAPSVAAVPPPAENAARAAQQPPVPGTPDVASPLPPSQQYDGPAQTVRERMENRLKNLPPEERERKIREEEERIKKREERNAAAKARRDARRNALKGGSPAVDAPQE